MGKFNYHIRVGKGIILLKAVTYWLGRNSAHSFFPLHALNVSCSIIQFFMKYFKLAYMTLMETIRQRL